MNKILFILILIIAGLIYIFNIDKTVSDKFTSLNSFKQSYIIQVTKIGDFFDKYLGQADTIERLKKEVIALEKIKLLHTNSKTTLSNLINSYSSLSQEEHKITLSRVISYVDFDNYTKVWLDLPKKDDKILGLISDNYTAGIVINKSDKALALLNGNEKCNYAVYVGEKKAPGIVHGYHEKNYLTIKFIPIWIDIKVGDEVVTSGMDNIFFAGLKVGKVIAIKKMPDMQEAIIAPYAKAIQEKYFYVYSHETKEPKKETLIKKEGIQKK